MTYDEGLIECRTPGLVVVDHFRYRTVVHRWVQPGVSGKDSEAQYSRADSELHARASAPPDPAGATLSGRSHRTVV